jgi:HptB-dependent secretion and biofilm anti anti-sigma factor
MDIRTESGSGKSIYALSGQLTYRDNEAFINLLKEIDGLKGQKITLDLTALEYMDSFGVGLMVQAKEEAEEHQVTLVIANPVGAVRRLFEQMGLSNVLPITHGPVTEKHGGTALVHDGFGLVPLSAATELGIGLTGKLTIRTQAGFLPIIEAIGRQQGGVYLIDLSGLEYMDSSGLSLILTANDEARRVGVELRLRNPVSKVKALLHLAAIDSVLRVDG